MTPAASRRLRRLVMNGGLLVVVTLLLVAASFTTGNMEFVFGPIRFSAAAAALLTGVFAVFDLLPALIVWLRLRAARHHLGST